MKLIPSLDSFPPVFAALDLGDSIVGVVIVLSTIAYIIWLVKRDRDQEKDEDKDKDKNKDD